MIHNPNVESYPTPKCWAPTFKTLSEYIWAGTHDSFLDQLLVGSWSSIQSGP